MSAAGRSPARGTPRGSLWRDPATAMLAVVVLVGIALRGWQFFSERSLWHDEALLALNLIGRSFADSLGTLDFAQAASLPFMAAEWLVGKGFGYAEEPLRLIPLASGVAATVLFAILARRVLSAWAAVIATLLFVVSDGLVYYASELKPYSSDVMVTTALLLLGTSVLREAPSRRRGAALGLVGAALILSSFSAVFIAGSLIIVLLAQALGKRAALTSLLPMISMWGIATVALVLEARRKTTSVRDAFDPEATTGPRAHEESGVLDPEWLDSFGSGLLNAIGTAEERPASHLAKLAALAVVIGLVALARRRGALAALFTLPFLATMLASRLDLYPLTERTTLFLLPCLAILMAEGVTWPARRLRAPYGQALAWTLAVAVLAYPVYSAGRYLVEPRVKQETQPVLEALAAGWQRGDTLYLQRRAQYAFRYYADCDCMDPALPDLGAVVPFERVNGPRDDSTAVRPTTDSLIVGRSTSDAALFREEVVSQRGRIWFFQSHSSGLREARFLADEVPRVLDSLGTRRTRISRDGATLYLYEFGSDAP